MPAGSSDLFTDPLTGKVIWELVEGWFIWQPGKNKALCEPLSLKAIRHACALTAMNTPVRPVTHACTWDRRDLKRARGEIVCISVGPILHFNM